jgi:hypothetical protein
VLCLLVAGCGGGGEAPSPRTDAATPPPAQRETPAPGDAEVREQYGLPDRVPLHETGPAEFADEDVVRRWMDELRRGEIARAAARFATPASFANFGPPVQIRGLREAVTITASLPCGARVTHVGAAAGYVIYEAELTDRPGGDCGEGVGGRVAGAILVRDGEIAEWWRLPDRPRPAPGTVV